MILIFTILTVNGFTQNIRLDPSVRTGKLLNGFTYYIKKNTEPINRVQLYLVNNVGSVLERDDQRGLAHFMEHMSFNGTEHFPKNELVHYLQKSGVRFGADLVCPDIYQSLPDLLIFAIPQSSPSSKPSGSGCSTSATETAISSQRRSTATPSTAIGSPNRKSLPAAPSSSRPPPTRTKASALANAV